MKKPPETAAIPTRTITVLSISPMREDHISLNRIFDLAERAGHTNWIWAVRPAPTLETARPLLRENRIPIVLSESDLVTASWKEVLAEIQPLPGPPLLIVTSRLADDYLWAEALNLGAYDVLAKPFDAMEVIRIVTSAMQRRREGYGPDSGKPRQRAAATGT
jgi:DNA-binding response OmpR family regulator